MGVSETTKSCFCASIFPSARTFLSPALSPQVSSATCPDPSPTSSASCTTADEPAKLPATKTRTRSALTSEASSADLYGHSSTSNLFVGILVFSKAISALPIMLLTCFWARKGKVSKIPTSTSSRQSRLFSTMFSKIAPPSTQIQTYFHISRYLLQQHPTSGPQICVSFLLLL